MDIDTTYQNLVAEPPTRDKVQCLKKVDMPSSLLKLLTILILLSSQSWGEDAYVRMLRTQAGAPKAFQTATVRMLSPEGATVDLIGVVHFADPRYYDKLNKLFKNYDAVLYEMVLDIPKSVAHQNRMRAMLGFKKREPKIDTRLAGRDSLSKTQLFLADLLGLEYQLHGILYNQANFRHADLTLQEFEQTMAGKPSSPLDTLKKFFQLEQRNSPPEFLAISKLPLLKILTAGPNPAERKVLKIGLASHFSALDDEMNDIQGSALIKERDARAVEILQFRVKKGEKKLAIFYGAAHTKDFVTQLKALGWKTKAKTWMTAWNLN